MAVTLIGAIMALIAVAVDFTQATVADLKYGYCESNIFLEREACCRAAGKENLVGQCEEFRIWVTSREARFGVYVGWAVLFGVISSSVTMLSKTALPAVSPGLGDRHKHLHNHRMSLPRNESHELLLVKTENEKSLYMSAGSGIPEIKVCHWLIPSVWTTQLTFACPRPFLLVLSSRTISM
jgi:chloride channel 3/4/5